jgi:PAS domain S-box-containing protein
MVQQSQEVFWLTSADYRQCLYVSHDLDQIWGHTTESLYQYPGGLLNFLTDSLHPSDRAQVTATFVNPLKQQHKVEYRTIQPDGSIRWVRSRFFPIPDHLGKQQPEETSQICSCSDFSQLNAGLLATFSEDITELKKQEEALQENQTLFQTIFELAPLGMAIATLQGKFTYSNRALEQLLGYSQEELLNLSLLDLIHPGDKTHLWKEFQQLILGEKTHCNQLHRYFCKDGSLIWCNLSISTVCDANGTSQHAIAIFQDITTQKQVESEQKTTCDELEKVVAERTAALIESNTLLIEEIVERKQIQIALKAQKDFLQNIIDINPNIIFVKDDQGKFILVNQVFADFQGISIEEILGKTTHELPASQLEKNYWDLEDQLVLSTLQTQVFPEVIFTRSTGEIHYFHIVKKPLLSPDRQTQLVLGVCTDITERHKFVETLTIQKDFLQSVIDMNPCKIFVKDIESKYILANQLTADFHGLELSEILGKTDAQLKLPPALAESFLTQDREIITTLQDQFIPEINLTSSKGETLWYQIIKKPFFAKDGQILGVLGVCTDITAQKLAEQAKGKSEKLYRLLVERMNEGLIVVDANGLITYVNHKHCEMLGYSSTEFIGHHMSEFWDEANTNITTEQWAQRQRGESGSFELVFRRKNGQKLLTLFSETPILGSDGSFEGSFGVITNITAIKTVEAELQEAKEQLLAVLDAVPGFVSWISTDGRYCGVNKHLAGAFNLSPEDFIGKELGFMKSSPGYAGFIANFLEKPVQTDSQIIDSKVNKEKRSYLIVAQKYNQGSMAVSVGIDITERQQIEEALKSQKEFLYTVIDTNPNQIFVKDIEGKYVLVNQACADFYGLTIKDLIGKKDTELNLNPADLERVLAQDKEVLAKLQPMLIPEESFHISTTEFHWFQTIKKPLFSSEGKVSGIFGVCINITKRKLTEEQLRRSEAQLRLALEAAHMGFWNSNLQTGVSTWSSNFKKLYGLPLDSGPASYEKFLLCVHPEDRDRVHQASMWSLETGEDGDLEFRIILPDGNIRWMQSKFQVFFDEMGKPLRKTGIDLDISERKQAEEQLRHNEAQLRLALDAARMGFWDWNMQTGLVTWSSNFKELFGLAPHTTEGPSETFLATVHPDDRDRLYPGSLCSVDPNKSNDNEFRVVLPDGNIRWMQSKFQVFYDETGKPIRMIGIDLDITERKFAETKLKNSLREKEVLLQEIHHRVKNNLQVIYSLLDLQSQHIDNQATLNIFQESQNRVRSMALVHEKLYQSKDFATLNFSEYIHNLIGYLFEVYRVDTNLITLEIDVEQVTLNIDMAIPCGLIINELVSNALKYAFVHGNKGTIKVALYSQVNNQLMLVVRDNGRGFSANWDLKEVKTLGLQLVNVLTNQIDGILELDCSRGTEFRISFAKINC